MISKTFIESLTALGFLLALGTLVLRAEGQAADPITDALNRHGYEKVGNGKYAVVINRYGTWYQALVACNTHLPGGTLFTVDNAQDFKWLGTKINYEKDHGTGASKFWVGLISQSVRGPLVWLSGRVYRDYLEVVQVSGYDDVAKRFAWAVPNGSVSKLKYEFLTIEDKAEAYICQYTPYLPD